MNVFHFIGVEPKGGNVRYAKVMHQFLGQLGVSSQILPVGHPPSLAMFGEFGGGAVTFVCHAAGAITRAQLQDLRKLPKCRLIAFAHNTRLPKNSDLFDVVVPVSEYVRRTLLVSGIDPRIIYRRPAYFPASALTEIDDLGTPEYGNPIQRSEYDWNLKKPRDFVLSYFDQIRLRHRENRTQRAKSDMSQVKRVRLGIVSRIARAKQFPDLFRLLHSGLVTVADKVEIHIVGSGPWRQVRDLKSQIPEGLRSHVFFWGWQQDPWACLPKFHALLLGLPENEALGLNILEATIRKIPVIGIDGGPFSEVVESGRNGWLVAKNSASNELLETISKLESNQSPCSFEMSAEYTYRFSAERFYETLRDLLDA